MNDKDILKRLLELGLEKLVEQSGQNLEDFIKGQNIPPKEEQVAPQPEPENINYDNAEHERRFGKNQE